MSISFRTFSLAASCWIWGVTGVQALGVGLETFQQLLGIDTAPRATLGAIRLGEVTDGAGIPHQP